MAFNQEGRQLGIKTPLGDNEVVLTAIEGHEEMSRLFEFKLELISENPAITAADIVGQAVTFNVTMPDRTPRFFHGIVKQFTAGDSDAKKHRSYSAVVVPWLWFLTRTADCRIFQEMSLPEIIEDVFNGLGFNDYKLDLAGTHPTHEYTVQYRESDFNFISRLAEEEGIYWYFEFEDGKHTLVLADHAGAYVDCEENEVNFPPNSGGRAVENHITAWEHRYEFRSGKWSQTDYNFETPSSDLETTEQTNVDLPGMSDYEVFDYPGHYGNTGDGKYLARYRMEEEEVDHEVVTAESLCRSFRTGGKFTITQHCSEAEEGKSYVITKIQHEAHEIFGYESGNRSGAEFDYKNKFECIPDSVTFRPARITRRPFVQGPQTAVVVGPPGEEIYPDEYGRVKVQFHWDRLGKNDQHSSCWIRVSSPWAGSNFGVIHIPRIGQEVIVNFLEGDPDRPIITGRVYNAEQMPPWELPANKTQSGIQTRSSQGGDVENCNQIRFEDMMGSEQLLVHAELNYDIEVESDETHWVGHDRTKTIDNDETTHVKNNQDETVDANRTVHVKGAFDEKIDSGETRRVTGGVDEQIIGGEERKIIGNQKEEVLGTLDQMVLGGSKIMTPATWDLTAMAGVKITAPAGVQVIAPGGQQQVDSFWKHVGSLFEANFAQKIQVNGVSVQTNVLTNSVNGIVNEINGFKVENTANLASSIGNQISVVANDLTSGGPEIHIHAITIIM